MSSAPTIPAVQSTVTVAVPIQTAFRVFTEGFDTWWPRTHHIAQVDLAEAVLERREGGRWYERGVDGSECEWGRVLAWDPPRRLVVSWHLDGDFEYDADPSRASEVEVRFTADGSDRTRVQLEHRHLERHGRESGEKLRAGVSGEGGWRALMRDYAETAA